MPKVSKIKRVSDSIARAYKMRILHVSDTHGGLPRLHGTFDLIIHSGDFFPDMTTDRTKSMALQLDWMSRHMSDINQWLQGTPMLFVLGNHDWLHPELMEQTLQSEGIKATSLHNKIVNYQGLNFYGFPYVPVINGMFNYECGIDGMTEEVDAMVSVLNEHYVDILVAHAPMYKVLDLTRGNVNIGSTVISNAFDYKLKKEMVPTHYLCGHCHEANGITIHNGMLVSNAACTYHVIEVL